MPKRIFARVSPLWLMAVLPVVIGQLYSLTLVKASIRELAEESSLIITGKIIKIECQWQDESSKAIFTDLTVAVSEHLKGEEHRTIGVRQLGGKIGDFGMEIPGTPLFAPGDEVVLFLVAHRGTYWIHSIALGCFNIATAENGQKVVFNDLPGVNLLDPATRQSLEPGSAYAQIPLHDFLQEIKSYIR
jgi:hypothetical protein